MGRYLSIEQLIANLLPCYSKQAIYKMAQRRQIPHYKIGKRIVFCEDEIARWVERFHLDEQVDGC